ncbi:MAG: tetratricopeptide repeat protein [Rhodothermia bacterium]|nr:tetratricopeptide repeat protein [Rhodothermia bacterium]
MLITSEPSAELLATGRARLLGFRIAEAEKVFRRLASRRDGRAAGHFHLASASLLKLLVSDRPEFYQEFYDRSDALREILDELPESAWKSFFEAEVTLHRAIVRAKDGSYLRAAYAGRKAYRSYKSLVESAPAFEDAYKGLGLLQMAVGSMPSFYRTFLGVLGVGGTVDEGLANLNRAVDHSLFGREESIIVLSLFDIVMDTDSGNKALLTSLYRTNPESPLFAHLYGFMLYSDRKAAEAEHVLRPIAERYTTDGHFYVDYIDFFLADAVFRQDRFQQSVTFFQRYLDSHRGPALKATASYKMGLALEMMGNRNAAESFYADVRAAREFDSDQVARRAAERLLSSPMSPTDRQMLLGRNAFDSARYDRALSIFSEILTDSSNDSSRRAEAAYRMARTHHLVGRVDDALAAYEESISLSANSGARWAPWSEYYSGKALEAVGRPVEARSAYKRASAYQGDFDYHQALEKNVKLALSRL